MWLEAALCFAFPLLMLPLLYVVQGHRYDVVESIGCSIPTYISWPGIVIRFVVPLVMSVASMMYAGELEFQLHNGIWN
jgi:pheromone a factor receptor